jgi:small subunit ribosomal protein S20
MRESPVATEKIAADHAKRRPGAASPRGGVYEGACYDPAAALSGPFHAMANIKQQKKRVRIAARQRLENLRYRSTIKTLTKRLEKVAEEGGKTVADEHRELVRWIDRAASRGAMHRNAAARKKSQAARLVSGKRS